MRQLSASYEPRCVRSPSPVRAEWSCSRAKEEHSSPSWVRCAPRRSRLCRWTWAPPSRNRRGRRAMPPKRSSASTRSMWSRPEPMPRQGPSPGLAGSEEAPRPGRGPAVQGGALVPAQEPRQLGRRPVGHTAQTEAPRRRPVPGLCTEGGTASRSSPATSPTTRSECSSTDSVRRHSAADSSASSPWPRPSANAKRGSWRP